MGIDGKALLAEVKENIARLDGCEKHAFDPADYKPGRRMACLVCGGEMQPTRISAYIQVYEAAGGVADDIWPGYRREKNEAGI